MRKIECEKAALSLNAKNMIIKLVALYNVMSTKHDACIERIAFQRKNLYVYIEKISKFWSLHFCICYCNHSSDFTTWNKDITIYEKLIFCLITTVSNIF